MTESEFTDVLKGLGLDVVAFASRLRTLRTPARVQPQSFASSETVVLVARFNRHLDEGMEVWEIAQRYAVTGEEIESINAEWQFFTEES